MGISVLLVTVVAAAFVLLPVHSKQDYKLNGFSTDDLSQINENANDGFLGAELTELQSAGRCGKSTISIYQGQIGLTPNGIPIFSVQIMNLCGKGCTVSRIHLACGAFTSVTLIDPNTFKRIRMNDCLVNGGRPLKAGEIVHFTYQTSFQHHLSVSRVKC